MLGGATGGIPLWPLYWLVVGWLPGRGLGICVLLLRELVSWFCSSLLASVGVGWMWSMACVQGTWWGVGGGVVGGWWGFWLWCLVSGWGWVLGLGCLVGGGVWLVGSGSWMVGGVVCVGAAPLRPLLNSLPHPLGVLWFLVRVVPLLVGGVCWLVGVLWVAVLFCWGGLVLWVVCLAACVLVGLFSTWGRGCCSCWSLRFGRVFAGGVPCLLAPWVVSLSGGCSQACCVVPVGWADLDGRALRRPPLSPPTIHDRRSQTPKSGGRTHTLKR